MSIVLGIGACVILIFFIIGGLIAMAFIVAKNAQWAVFLPENSAMLFMAGEDHQDTVLNWDAHVLVDEDEGRGPRIERATPDIIAKEKNKGLFPLDTYLWRRWGFLWVGWGYPWEHVLEFEISKARLLEKKAITSKDSILQRIEFDTEPEIVNHLRCNIERPFGLVMIDTKGEFSGNILLGATFELVYPKIPAIRYKGRFFNLLESAITMAVSNFVLNHTYESFRDLDKGPKSDFIKAIMSINDDPAGEMALEGIIKSLGWRMTNVWFEGLEPGAESKEVIDALRANELARLKGLAVKTSAKAFKEASQDQAAGEAAPTAALVKAFPIGTSPDVIAQTIASMRRSDSFRHLAGKDSKISVLSIGDSEGSGIQRTVNVHSQLPTPSQRSPSSIPAPEPETEPETVEDAEGEAETTEPVEKT